MGEIKKLNDQLSQLRQENINLKVSEEWGNLREDKKAPVLLHGPGSIQTPNTNQSDAEVENESRPFRHWPDLHYLGHFNQQTFILQLNFPLMVLSSL